MFRSTSFSCSLRAKTLSECWGRHRFLRDSVRRAHENSKWIKRRQTIQSLDRNRLKSTDHINLTYAATPHIRTVVDRPPTRTTKLLFKHGLLDSDNRYGAPPFPEGTRGFLYYHLADHAPEISGEVRFRVVATNHPSAFFNGRDLLSTEGLPWRIPLLVLASEPRYTNFLRLLIQDGMVSHTLVERCRNFERAVPLRFASRLLYTIDDLFYLDFAQHCTLKLVLTNCITNWRLHFGAARDPRNIQMSPYGGSALCRFEKQPNGAFALRIVKIVNELRLVIPNYDGFRPSFIEGELLLLRQEKLWKAQPKLRGALESLPTSAVSRK